VVVEALPTAGLVGAVVNEEEVLTLAEFIPCGFCALDRRGVTTGL
jgi:hypothetical protein